MECKSSFKVGRKLPSLCSFSLFFKQHFKSKEKLEVSSSGIRTRIVEEKGRHADHLTSPCLLESNPVGSNGALEASTGEC